MSRIALVVRWLALRTARGPLRAAWRILFEALIRGLAAALRRGLAGSAYVRGSFGFGEPVYGLSDIDLILVVPDSSGAPGHARERVRERWQRIARALPTLGRLVVVNVYEQADLADAARSTVLTYGLDRGDGDPRYALFFGERPPDVHYSVRVRPGLYGPTSDWRLVAGRDRRPGIVAPAGLDRWPPAWLDLECWWRYAFWASAEDDPLAVTDLCVKLVAEAARIWLWVAHGEREPGRPAVLERALRRLPEEEQALRLALALHRRLPAAEPSLGPVVSYLLRMSSRLAARLAADVEGEGATRVRLHWPDAPGLASPTAGGGPPEGRPILPLVDWRARAFPEPPDESFVLLAGSPESPAVLAAAARTEAPGDPRPVLRAPGLLVMPTLDLVTRPLIRGALRAVQCAATDPVSFALADCRRDADFPDLPGWSALDGARRAAAEHRAWLADPASLTDPGGKELGMLFTYVRAALFLESLERGDPELPLTVAAVAERLGGWNGGAQGLADEAAGEYLRWRLGSQEPSPRLVLSLAELVRLVAAGR